MKLPAFQFYPADWRKDPGVQSLDFETRGIWFEMLCLMHESDERGVLLLNGRPMPVDALARLLGLDNQKTTTALSTLTTYGVARVRPEDGAIFSKRMVADEKLRQIRKEAGSKGGNPVLLNQKATSQVKQIPTPSSSSSSSSSITSSEDIKPLPLTAPAPPALVDERKIEVGSWFGRRASTQWSVKELKAWKAIHPEDLAEGIAILKAPYEAKAKYTRKDLQNLLNNWTGEIDRWRNWQAPAASDVTNRQNDELPAFLEDDNAIFHHKAA